MQTGIRYGGGTRNGFCPWDIPAGTTRVASRERNLFLTLFRIHLRIERLEIVFQPADDFLYVQDRSICPAFIGAQIIIDANDVPFDTPYVRPELLFHLLEKKVGLINLVTEAINDGPNTFVQLNNTVLHRLDMLAATIKFNGQTAIIFVDYPLVTLQLYVTDAEGFHRLGTLKIDNDAKIQYCCYQKDNHYIDEFLHSVSG